MGSEEKRFFLIFYLYNFYKRMKSVNYGKIGGGLVLIKFLWGEVNDFFFLVIVWCGYEINMLGFG